VTPTRARVLVGIAVVAAAVGWGATQLVDAYLNRTLPVPWTMPVVMVLLALALTLWARGTRDRLAGKPGAGPIDPLVAARSAALAMAASRTGAAVAGFYVGVVVALVPSWDYPAARERVIVAGITVLGALLVVAAALWLEHVCRIPPDGRGLDADGDADEASL
jgi:4-amino-4-deoxy-L-arabinose transferase-like glycosyltransferase